MTLSEDLERLDRLKERDAAERMSAERRRRALEIALDVMTSFTGSPDYLDSLAEGRWTAEEFRQAVSSLLGMNTAVAEVQA